jgi:hypothetical protein
MKKRLLPISVVLAVFLTSSFTAVAQQPDSAATVSSGARLSDIRLNAPKISGFANFRYQQSDEADFHPGFDVRRARLSASGDVNSSIDYKVQAEYETTVKVLDAYFRWKIVPQFNVQVGQFKAPFTQESYNSPTQEVVIDNHTVVSKLNGYKDLSGIQSNGRDAGIQFYGLLFPSQGFSLVEYKVGIFNGDGINTTAQKDDKAGAGLLYLHPVKPLTVSAGYYAGSYTGYRSWVKTDSAEAVHVRNRATVGAKYDDGRLLVRSEYVYGNTAGLRSEGVYAVLAYAVTPQWQPLLSYDYFRKNKDANADDQIYQIGLNYLPIRNLRLQLAYSFKKSTGKDDVNYAVAQATFQF